MYDLRDLRVVSIFHKVAKGITVGDLVEIRLQKNSRRGDPFSQPFPGYESATVTNIVSVEDGGRQWMEVGFPPNKYKGARLEHTLQLQVMTFIN